MYFKNQESCDFNFLDSALWWPRIPEKIMTHLCYGESVESHVAPLAEWPPACSLQSTLTASVLVASSEYEMECRIMQQRQDLMSHYFLCLFLLLEAAG